MVVGETERLSTLLLAVEPRDPPTARYTHNKGHTRVRAAPLTWKRKIGNKHYSSNSHTHALRAFQLLAASAHGKEKQFSPHFAVSTQGGRVLEHFLNLFGQFFICQEQV